MEDDLGKDYAPTSLVHYVMPVLQSSMDDSWYILRTSVVVLVEYLKIFFFPQETCQVDGLFAHKQGCSGCTQKGAHIEDEKLYIKKMQICPCPKLHDKYSSVHLHM